jgi:hypothetical protein
MWGCHDKALRREVVMGIYEIFALNLRRHCSAFGSIAAVCRGCGINRQQFNKYLAGQILPNSRTLKRISGFLGICEVDLFQNSAIVLPATIPEYSAAHELETVLRETVPRLKRDSDVLKEGYYFCYFPLQNHENYLMRSLLKVKIKNGISCFTRLTLTPSRAQPGIFLGRGKHVGVVLATAQEIYLLATNTSSSQLSLITIDRSFTACAPVLQGMVLTRGLNAQMACRVMVDFVGAEINLRQAIKKLGPVSTEDREINRHIVFSLSANSSSDKKPLTAIDNEELMFR